MNDGSAAVKFGVCIREYVLFCGPQYHEPLR